MRVNREDLLNSLEAVAPGLSQREVLEQSSCFAIKEGMIYTFNDEVACTAPIKLDKGVTGAVQAAKLLDLLRKMPDEEIEVLPKNEELLIRGAGRLAGVRMEAQIMLPIDQLEQPKNWKGIDSELTDALMLVQECAGRDLTKFALACVHIHPKWVEACDNFQMMRYRISTGIDAPTLVKRDSLKHIVGLGVVMMSETPSWLHFKNGSGLIISCRRYVEDYVDFTKELKMEGGKAQLPKGLVQAAEMAEIFSGENKDSNQVTIELSKGRLKIRGQGVSGWYSESKKINYDGERLSFLIAPNLLKEICKKHNECRLTEKRLRVDGGRWRYVACLGVVEGNGKHEED